MLTGRVEWEKTELRSNNKYINAEIKMINHWAVCIWWLVLGRFFTKGRSTQGKTIKLQVVINRGSPCCETLTDFKNPVFKIIMSDRILRQHVPFPLRDV